MTEYDLRCMLYDDYIKTDRQRKWLDTVLQNVNIRIYANEIEEQRKDYDDYLLSTGLDINEFRALAWPSGLIVLNGLHETDKSLCWLLLHELGHVTVNLMEKAIDNEVLKMLSGGALNEMTREEYIDYSTNDDVHEARYEEQFANQFANVIMGECYDRHWWRKNKLQTM